MHHPLEDRCVMPCSETCRGLDLHGLGSGLAATGGWIRNGWRLGRTRTCRLPACLGSGNRQALPKFLTLPGSAALRHGFPCLAPYGADAVRVLGGAGAVSRHTDLDGTATPRRRGGSNRQGRRLPGRTHPRDACRSRDGRAMRCRLNAGTWRCVRRCGASRCDER